MKLKFDRIFVYILISLLVVSFAAEASAVSFRDDFSGYDTNSWTAAFSQYTGSDFGESNGSVTSIDDVLYVRPDYYRATSVLQSENKIIDQLPAAVKFRVRYAPGFRASRIFLTPAPSINWNYLNTMPFISMGLSCVDHFWVETNHASIKDAYGNSTVSNAGGVVMPDSVWLDGTMKLFSDRIETSFNGVNHTVYGDVQSVVDYDNGLKFQIHTNDDYLYSGFDLDWIYNDDEAPIAPILKAKAASSTAVNLTWSDATETASGLDRYVIERSLDQASYQVIDETLDTSFTDTGLTPSTRYYYRIEAFDKAGFSSTSLIDSAKTKRP